MGISSAAPISGWLIVLRGWKTAAGCGKSPNDRVDSWADAGACVPGIAEPHGGRREHEDLTCNRLPTDSVGSRQSELTRERQVTASPKTATLGCKALVSTEAVLGSAPRKGRCQVLFCCAPLRGLGERPWLAPFLFAPLPLLWPTIPARRSTGTDPSTFGLSAADRDFARRRRMLLRPNVTCNRDAQRSVSREVRRGCLTAASL